MQWGLAYAAGAWALLEALTHVVATFHWPEQVQQIGTLLLPVGLPIVVTLAWYHGDRGQQRVTRPELAVQDDIATAVVRQLKLRLLAGRLPARSTTRNAEAYVLFLQSRYLADLRTEKSLRQSYERLTQALALDPGYADAWAALGELQVLRVGWGK